MLTRKRKQMRRKTRRGGTIAIAEIAVYSGIASLVGLLGYGIYHEMTDPEQQEDNQQLPCILGEKAQRLKYAVSDFFRNIFD